MKFIPWWWRNASTAVFLVLLTQAEVASALAPALKLQFGFNQASGTTANNDAPDAKSELRLQILDFNGTPLDGHGRSGSGVAGGAGIGDRRALDFCSANAQGTNGPVAAATNSVLDFGELKAFTASLWFKLNSQQAANIGPRLFVLGAEEAGDTGATNSLGLKFQTASSLQFQLNRVVAEADLGRNMPTNQWMFAAMVYDGSSLFVYLGETARAAELVLAKAAPAQTVHFGNTGALFIGNRRDRARSFNGYIDDFRFYIGPADALEVEAIRVSAAGPLGKTAATDQPSSPGEYVVVTAPAFASALAPLLDRRRSEGFRTTLINTAEVSPAEGVASGTGATLWSRLKSILNGPGRKQLLLVGASSGDGSDSRIVVPSLLGKTARMKGRPTDFGYALPAENGLPTVAVGRLPARDAKELEGMVAKTLRFERAAGDPAWRNRITLLQGNPGGGPLAEMFVEGFAGPRLSRLHPSWHLAGLSHNPPSGFFLPAGMLSIRSVEYLSAGQLFSVYLGHSGPEGLFSVNTNFLSSDAWSGIDMSRGQGVFFTCGCFACKIEPGKATAYGLAAIRNPSGPVAVIGATEESYAAPGVLALDGLLACLAATPFPERLGDCWLAVQRGLAEGPMDAGTFGLLDMSDGSQGKLPLSVQRLEHLEMWELLGDPALNLPLVPLTLTISSPGRVTPGNLLELTGTLPPALTGASVVVSLERLPGTRPPDLKPPAPKEATAAERDHVVAGNHARMNNYVIVATPATVSGTRFTSSLRVPTSLALPMVTVKAFAQTDRACAQGVVKLPVMQAQGIPTFRR